LICTPCKKLEAALHGVRAASVSSSQRGKSQTNVHTGREGFVYFIETTTGDVNNVMND